MTRAVLDASALLAFVAEEPGMDAVAEIIGEAAISTVNFAEAIEKLVQRGMPLEAARRVLGMTDIDVVDFDRALAETTGGLAARTRDRGLSLGDRACLALAARERLPAVTADRAWQSLDVGVDIRLIR